MGCSFLDESGLPTPCSLEIADALVVIVILPFALYRLWQYSRPPAISAKLTIAALASRKAAFCSSVVFAGLCFANLSLPNVPLLVMAPVASTLHYYELKNRHSSVASAELLLWWMAQTLLTVSKLAAAPSVLKTMLAVMAITTWLLEMYSSPWDPKGYEEVSIFGKVTMSFLTNMIKAAQSRTLSAADFAGRPNSIGMENAYKRFQKTFEAHTKGGKYRVLLTLMTFYKWQLVLLLLLGVVADLVSYTQPLLLSLFLRSLQGSRTSENTSYEPIYFAFGIGFAQLSVNLINGLRQISSNAMFLNSRTALMEMIYRKALSISSDARTTFDTAKIMNLLNVDTTMVQMAYSQLTILISAPIGLILCTVQLYAFLGNATLAAVPLYALYMPYSSWATKRQLKRFPQSMKAKDERAKSTLSVMRNIKSLKLYAWEKPYEKRVVEDRKAELDVQRKFLRLRVAFRTVTGQLDNVVVTAVFLAFLYMTGEPLTPQIVFPALSMISLVSEPLFALPSAISELGGAFTAQQRILEFLEQPEELYENYFREPAVRPDDFDSPLLEISNARIHWGKALDSPVAVMPFELKLRRGDLCCVLGKVGSGKSALLKALCSQLFIKEGSITTRGSLAYASQEPWLQFKTLRDNILFGLEYDEAFYTKTIQCCDLMSDIALFPEGDMTEIGEKGISLSGGQKARVALARAVYSRADVIILDDVLSAVDQHVSSKLLKNLFASDGLFASRVVFLATHTAKSLKLASHLLCLARGGRIVFNGSPVDADASELVSATGEGMDASTIADLLPAPSFNRRSEVRANVKQATADNSPKIDKTNANVAFAPTNFTREEMLPDVPIVGIYRRYLDTAGRQRTLLMASLLALSIFTVSMVSVWLTIWSAKGVSGLSESKFYVNVFLVIVILAAVLDAASYYSFFGMIALRASQKLHDKMLHNVIHVPMAFFERTPLGAIMTRFTGDIATLDGSLPRMMYFFLSMLLTTFSNLAIAIFGSPIIALILVPMMFQYNGYRKAYVPSSRQLQKLSSASQGPLLSHIEESIRGVVTLAVFNVRDQFIQGFEHRGNYWAHTTFLRFALRRWLNSRIALMTATVVTASALSVVALVQYWNLPVSVAGVVLHGVRVAGSRLSRIIASWTQIEVSAVGVERIFDYTDLKREAAYHLDASLSPVIGSDWPAKGAVVFQHYSTRFRPELEDVLHDITLDIAEGEKVGIVGRTGAGKSSLTMALFRILEPRSGSITIDNVDISTLGLFDLRSRLSIIPQEAQIFKGTLRQNLDPLMSCADAKLWQVLELCHLKDHFEHGLDTEVQEGGENISRGQAQLICLGRALLRPTKILVLDEATASVDTNTDSFVQATIRREFKDRTIITIAHRLDTVMDCDRILVLAEGRVVEFDAPQKLLEKKGAFYDLTKSYT